MIQHFPILAIMVLFFGAFFNLLLGKRSRLIRTLIVIASTGTALGLMLALIKPVMIDGGIIAYWMGDWAPIADFAYGIGLEVDALSLFFGLIITTAVFVSGLYSFEYMSHDDSLVNFYTLYLMLAGGVLGLVLSGDLFNVFVMIEIMTFSAVALTAFRNDTFGSLEAAFKYLVVGSIGSSCVLIGTILIYAQLHTLNMAQIAALLPGNLNPVTVIAFAFLFIGFATKAFLFPFHPLAADAHAVAPSSISVLISGVLTKTGVYGIIRLVYFLYQNISEQSVQYLLILVGSVSMFVCVTMALAQHNFKRLLAFHSISQIGYVITAIGLSTALGVSAGLYHAMNHTLFKGLLFLCAGAVLHQTGTVDLDDLGGLAKRMPKTTILFLIGAFSISGLPPFNGFVSKWMIYQAAYERALMGGGSLIYVFVTVVALLTSVLTLASFIKVAQSVFFGQLPEKYKDVEEVPFSMRAPMWLLAILCILTGVFPEQVYQYLIGPATAAVFNVFGYVAAMLGDGLAWAVTDIPNIAMNFINTYWNPLYWLILLFVVLAAVTLVSLMGKKDRGKLREEAGNLDPKYEPFYGGEASEFSQVGGSDLFWGFKHNLKPYLNFMHDAHSGVVNDYALWGVAALALAILFAILWL